MSDTRDAVKGKDAFLNFVGLGLGLFFVLAGFALMFFVIAWSRAGFPGLQ